MEHIEISQCYNCNQDIVHELSSELKALDIYREAEYCYVCDEAYCPDCMDFTVNDNTCIYCAGAT